MIREYEIVRLKKPIPLRGLSMGIKGTVLIVYNEPGLPRAYEVEFLDENGETLAVITLQEDDIEKA